MELVDGSSIFIFIVFAAITILSLILGFTIALKWFFLIRKIDKKYNDLEYSTSMWLYFGPLNVSLWGFLTYVSKRQTKKKNTNPIKVAKTWFSIAAAYVILACSLISPLLILIFIAPISENTMTLVSPILLTMFIDVALFRWILNLYKKIEIAFEK